MKTANGHHEPSARLLLSQSHLIVSLHHVILTNRPTLFPCFIQLSPVLKATSCPVWPLFLSSSIPYILLTQLSYHCCASIPSLVLFHMSCLLVFHPVIFFLANNTNKEKDTQIVWGKEAPE